jgi:hypothetical protein
MQPGFRVDRELKTIFDVCLLGPQSKNGWKYSSQVIEEAAPRYNRKPVYLNHIGTSGKRDVRDVAGRIASPRLKEGRLYGDIKCIGRNGEMLMELAESDVDGIGMSHLTDNESRVIEKTKTVLKIGGIKSVDVVDNPGTTKTLKEDTALELKEQFEPILSGKKSVIDRLKAVYEATGIEFKLEEQELPEAPKLTIETVKDLEKIDSPAVRQLVEQFHDLQKKDWAREVIREHKLPDNDKTLKAITAFDSKDAMVAQAVVLKEMVDAVKPVPGTKQAGRVPSDTRLTVDLVANAFKGR